MKKLIASIHKTATEVVRVALDEFAVGGQVHQMVAIRIWYTDGEEWKPTRKGINLKVEFLPKLIAALISAGEVLDQGRADTTSTAPLPAAPKPGTIRLVKAP
mgnify:CR=1 FL=1